MWYLEKQFSAKVKDHPRAEKLGLQVADVQAAVAAFKNATWREKTDLRVKEGQFEHDAHPCGRGKPAEEGVGQEDEEVASRKRKRSIYNLEQDLDLDLETASSHTSRPELQKAEYRGCSRPASGDTTNDLTNYSQEASAPMLFAVPSLSSPGHGTTSLPQLSQYNSPQMEQGLGDQEAAEKREELKESYPTANMKSIESESETAYRRHASQEWQEGDIVCTSARRKSAQDGQLQAMKPEAVTLQYASPELARVKSANMELEAAHGIDVEQRNKLGDKAFKNLVVDVQAARRPHTAPPPSPQVVPDASRQPSPRHSAPPQRRHPSRSPKPSLVPQNGPQPTPNAQHGMRTQHPHPMSHTHPAPPSQLAYAQYMAARQHAHAQLSSQPHTFPFTPVNARHAGPYTPISPRHYAHPTHVRKSPPPPVRTTPSQHHLPPTPMSPRLLQHASSPHSPRRTSIPQNAQYSPQLAPSPRTPCHPSLHLHQRSPYLPPYIPAPPQTPRNPPTASQQQQQQYDLPPRESAEVMLRKLELEEAEAKLRTSITQERLRAEVVAKKKALARALMMEEKGLR